MHEPKTGTARGRTPRAESVAARLAALTDSTPRVTIDEATVRIEVDLPPKLSDTARHNLLVALADADRCGHQVDDGYVWAEICELPDPARLTPDQCTGYACALCGLPLYVSRFLGTVAGHQLHACSPTCPIKPLARG